MSQRELLIYLAETLERLEIPYMVTGSIASSLQGEPRSTHDIDLVVDIPRPRIGEFLSVFPAPRFFLQEHVVLDAIRSRRMFTVLDEESGYKVDFWPIGSGPFDVSRFARRTAINYDGQRVWTSSAEDTILKKLRWSLDCGGSEKQFRDALRVYELQFSSMDHEYLKSWISPLEIQGLWDRLLREAKPLA